MLDFERAAELIEGEGQVAMSVTTHFARPREPLTGVAHRVHVEQASIRVIKIIDDCCRHRHYASEICKQNSLEADLDSITAACRVRERENE